MACRPINITRHVGRRPSPRSAPSCSRYITKARNPPPARGVGSSPRTFTFHPWVRCVGVNLREAGSPHRVRAARGSTCLFDRATLHRVASATPAATSNRRGLSQRGAGKSLRSLPLGSTTSLRRLFEVLPSLHVLRETFLLTKLLEAAHHLADVFAVPSSDPNRHMLGCLVPAVRSRDGLRPSGWSGPTSGRQAPSGHANVTGRPIPRSRSAIASD